jgi:predicted regulator of Ras-like GTPase activity (Roadblock/LC7/MglB family)
VALTSEAENLNWLINAFAERVPGVTHAVVVSADGLLVAASDLLPRDGADQLSAISSALVSLANGAATVFEGDGVRQTIIEMGVGFFLVRTVEDGSILAALALQNCDIGVVGYEMARLVKQVGELLTPSVRAELQAALPSPAPY